MSAAIPLRTTCSPARSSASHDTFDAIALWALSSSSPSRHLRFTSRHQSVMGKPRIDEGTHGRRSNRPRARSSSIPISKLSSSVGLRAGSTIRGARAESRVRAERGTTTPRAFVMAKPIAAANSVPTSMGASTTNRPGPCRPGSSAPYLKRRWSRDRAISGSSSKGAEDVDDPAMLGASNGGFNRLAGSQHDG